MKMFSLNEFTSSIINSILGPNKSNKLIVEDREAYVARCPLQIFQRTVLKDPLSSLLEETLLAHHTLYGCSNMSLLTMWYTWSEEFKLALDDGCEMQDIIKNSQNVLELVIASLFEISMSIDSLLKFKKCYAKKGTLKSGQSVSNQVPIAIQYSSRHFSPSLQTCVSSKGDNIDEKLLNLDENCLSNIVNRLDHDEDAQIANLISECWKKQIDFTNSTKKASFHCRFKTGGLLVCPVVLPSSNSSIIDGLIIKSNLSPSCFQHVKNTDSNRVLVINGGITFQQVHLGFSPKVSISAQKNMNSLLLNEKDIWQKKCCQLILDLHIDALLIKNDINPEIADFCMMNSVLVLPHLPWKTLKCFYQSSQYSPCTYILDCDEENVLEKVVIKEWRPNDNTVLVQQYFLLNMCSANKMPLQTIILCYPSHPILEMKEHQLWHLASRLSSGTLNGMLLPEGVEEHCCNFLKKQMQFQEFNDQKVKIILAIVNGFEKYSSIISRKKMQAPCPKVFDDFTSKISAWRSAMSLVLLSLQCDTSLINGIGSFTTKI